jgi:hypothetical protein
MLIADAQLLAEMMLLDEVKNLGWDNSEGCYEPETLSLCCD